MVMNSIKSLDIYKANTALGVDTSSKFKIGFKNIFSDTNSLFIAPEYYYGHKIHSNDELKRIIDDFSSISDIYDSTIIPGTVVWQDGVNMYNTALVFSNGSLICQYDKQSDNFESNFAKKNGLIYSSRSDANNPVFNLGSKSIGLEICREHGHGKLKKYLSQNNLPLVDMHIILSNGISLKNSNFASEDGLIIQADGANEGFFSPSANVFDVRGGRFLNPYKQVFSNTIERYEVK